MMRNWRAELLEHDGADELVGFTVDVVRELIEEIERMQAASAELGPDAGRSKFSRVRMGEAKPERPFPLMQAASAEPVAWRIWNDDEGRWDCTSSMAEAYVFKDEGEQVEPLYATPPPAIPELEELRTAYANGVRDGKTAAVPEGWQLIETAPSGVAVLCYWPPVKTKHVRHDSYICQAWRRFGNWFKSRDGYGAPTGEVNEPTYWMPLPAVLQPGTTDDWKRTETMSWKLPTGK